MSRCLSHDHCYTASLYRPIQRLCFCFSIFIIISIIIIYVACPWVRFVIDRLFLFRGIQASEISIQLSLLILLGSSLVWRPCIALRERHSISSNRKVLYTLKFRWRAPNSSEIANVFVRANRMSPLFVFKHWSICSLEIYFTIFPRNFKPYLHALKKSAWIIWVWNRNVIYMDVADIPR